MIDADSSARIVGLPGETLVRQGVADLGAGRRTVAACAVDIARSRLRHAGISWDRAEAPSADTETELELYALLRRESGDAYSRYNAVLRELDSFTAALDRRIVDRQP